MRAPAALLPALFLASLGGCATSGDDSAAPPNDASMIPDYTVGDTYTPPPDQTAPDTLGDDMYIPPTDMGVPDNSIPDAGDAGFDTGACTMPPLPCDTAGNVVMCPPFTMCQPAFVEGGAPDGGDAGDAGEAGDEGGTDADAGSPDAGPFLDGLCLFVFDLAPCNPGACPSGSRCLSLAKLCMNTAEVACVCSNPQQMQACGP